MGRETFLNLREYLDKYFLFCRDLPHGLTEDKVAVIESFGN